MLTSLISLLIQTADASPEVVNSAVDAASEGAKQAPKSGSPYQGLIMIVVLIAIFYFLLIRPQQKRQKEIRKQRESLREGDNIITAGGIYGKIVDIKDNALIVSISDNVKIKVDKNSVYPAGTDLQAQQK